MHFFAYGVLVVPEIMIEVTGKTFRCEEVRLRGYRRFKVKGSLHPAILPFPDRLTAGLVYYDIDDETVRFLDQFMGASYERTEVNVEALGGEWVEAETHVIRAEQRGALLREDWDEDLFLETSLSFFLKRGPID